MGSHQIIERAAQSIASPDRWGRCDLAVNKAGKPARTLSTAARFCIVGAVLNAGGQILSRMREHGIERAGTITALATVQLAAQRLYKMSAEQVNDTLGHEAVMEVLRLAWKQSRDEKPRGQA